MTPHKHADLIKAWADGAKIEYMSLSGFWKDVKRPSWKAGNEYRIKPEPIKSLSDQIRGMISRALPGSVFNEELHVMRELALRIERLEDVVIPQR